MDVRSLRRNAGAAVEGDRKEAPAMMPSGRPVTAERVFLFPLLAVAALAVALLTLLGLENARADYIYQPYGTWNGKKIYLSPARHSDAGGRGECQGMNENHMAFN